MRATMFRGAVVGGLAGTLCAAGAVALAGTGVGAVFNLGKTNSVNAQSTLTGSTADPQLQVENSGNGRGVASSSGGAEGIYAQSTSSAGVFGDSTNATGVHGKSSTTGVFGQSVSGDGVTGLSHSALDAGVDAGNPGDLALMGKATGNGTGLRGVSVAGSGVRGITGSGRAVVGQSDKVAAVIGSSGTATGVAGQTHSGQGFGGRAIGVSGSASGGAGVYGEGTIGVAGTGLQGGPAFAAFGNATQNRSSGGFVKAMAYIDPFDADPIRQCFNSQLPPDQATSGDCGLTYTHAALGDDVIDFGFAVYDRPVSVTPVDSGGDIGAELFAGNQGSSTPATAWEVGTFYASVNDSDNDAVFTDAPFSIVVY